MIRYATVFKKKNAQFNEIHQDDRIPQGNPRSRPIIEMVVKKSFFSAYCGWFLLIDVF